MVKEKIPEDVVKHCRYGQQVIWPEAYATCLRSQDHCACIILVLIFVCKQVCVWPAIHATYG